MAKIALWSTLVLAAGLSGAAVASDDPMAGAYGNTVLVTNAKGETSKIWINKDGSYKAQGADGKQGTGKWALKENGKKYCATANLPADAPKETPAPKEACSDFTGPHKVGDKWEQNDANGQKVTVEIRAEM